MRLCAFLLWAGLLSWAVEAANTPRAVARRLTNSSAAGPSLVCATTPDAQFVVFLSHANNLVTNDDTRTYADVFVRNMSNGINILVSKATTGVGGGDGHSGHASISRDGRFVVFASDASNLVANDTNGVSDVFRHDLQTGATELVSVSSSGGIVTRSHFAGVLGSSRPVMTPDGRYVAFESDSMDSIADDSNATRKVFLRDMQNAITTLASADASGCSSPSLSTNGKHTAFIAMEAGAITTSRSSANVLVRDLETGTTHWASSNVASILQVSGVYRCLSPTIAPSGSFVVFKVLAPGSSGANVIKYDVGTGQTFLLASNSHAATSVSLSEDEHWLGFEENGNAYLRDLKHNTNLLVSLNIGSTTANGSSHDPVISSNGRHVAFLSAASDLTTDVYPEDTTLYRIFVRDVVAGVTRLVTRGANNLPVAVSGAAHPFVSDDGQTVVFDTEMAALMADDNNAASDVFARKVEAGVTALLSSAHPNLAVRTGIQSSTVWMNSLSADGQRLAFTILDGPGGAADSNSQVRVFVAEIPTGALLVQDIPAPAVSWETRRVNTPLLSAGGAHILFESGIPFAAGVSGDRKLFWRRVDQGPALEVAEIRRDVRDFDTEWKAALNSNGTLVLAGSHLYDMIAQTDRLLLSEFQPVRRPMFSPDERWVLARDGSDSVFALHLASNLLVHVSKDSNGLSLAPSFVGVFNGSGNYYTFDSYRGATNSFQRKVFRYDFSRNATELICTNGASPSVDRIGNLTAFVSQEESAVSRNIYVTESGTGRRELISVNLFGSVAANGESKLATISADGRYVVFVSRGSDLVAGDNNNADDIFVRDRLYKTTHLLSRSRRGGSANALSSTPLMGRDGRTVVFQSFANDLVAGDYNEERDIFIVKLSAGDSDNDGMDDDWEVAHFGDLSRDGAGDQDGDGQTDLQEFLAGTNPTNNDSVLRVLTITPMGGGSTTVVWSAVVGRNYIVQYKDSLDASWTNASSVIEANTASASFADNSSSAQRFYRVIAVQ